MYNPNYIDWGPQGWRCPQCGRIWSPQTSGCSYCNTERKTFATTKTTITPFDDAGWWDDYMKRTSADSEINIGKDGSISWHGPAPEVYLENMSWRDWLDKQTNVWEE